jgi:hypothetical protein
VPNLTADCAITLPTPAAGLTFEFVYAGVAADAQDWNFTTGSNTNYFLGGVVHLDTDAGSAGDEVVQVAPDGNSNSKMNVLVPDVGTRVRFVSDGTLWYLDGTIVAATALASGSDYTLDAVSGMLHPGGGGLLGPEQRRVPRAQQTKKGANLRGTNQA